MNDKHRILLNNYETYLFANEIRTISAYLYAVGEYIAYLEKQCLPVGNPGKTIADEYRGMLITDTKRNPARRTINNKLNKIRSFYCYLVKKGMALYNPFEGKIGISVGYSIPKNILNIADMGVLLTNFSIKTGNDIMIKSIIELLYGSGLRISEVESIRLADIDFSRGMILINEKKTGIKRYVPASQNSLESVQKYLKVGGDFDGFLYPQKQSTTIRCLVNRKLKNECRRLGLKEITSHSFRHSAGTHLLRNGAGIREVQSFLGHKKISNTEIYTRVVKDDLANVINTFHPRERNV